MQRKCRRTLFKPVSEKTERGAGTTRRAGFNDKASANALEHDTRKTYHASRSHDHPVCLAADLTGGLDWRATNEARALDDGVVGDGGDIRAQEGRGDEAEGGASCVCKEGHGGLGEEKSEM